MAEAVTLVVLVGTGSILAGCVYALAGLPALWGPWHGVPLCGHPFEQTWVMRPPPQEWTCPKCETPFRREDDHWEPARRWGRDV